MKANNKKNQNLLSEVLSVFKCSFKTANKKVYLVAGIIGILLGGFMGFTLLMNSATNADLQGEKVSHKECLVTDMPMISYSNGRGMVSNSYELQTSCGNFAVNEMLYRTISLNNTYDLQATVGNWANKPTVVSAEETN